MSPPTADPPQTWPHMGGLMSVPTVDYPLRLVSGKRPRPFVQGEPDEYPLDAIAIFPQLSEPWDEACWIVRYDDLATQKVEGERFFSTLQEALRDAEEWFDIGRDDWILPPGFTMPEAAYQAFLAHHAALAGDSTA